MKERTKENTMMVAQWGFIAVVSTFAVWNSVNDHGVLMAINCISIGLVAGTMLGAKHLDNMLEQINEISRHRDALVRSVRATEEKVRIAIQTGRIEVVPIAPIDDDRRTRH